MRKCTHSMPISPMWLTTYSLSYDVVSEWRPVFPLAEMLSSGGSQKPLERPFVKILLYDSLLEPIAGFWLVFVTGVF